MAKASPSVLTGGLRGKAGNVVFVRQPGGGMSVRPRIAPANPKTPSQQAWRACVGAAGRAFSNLTSEQYLAWHAYAQDQVALGNLNSAQPSAAFTTLAAKFIQLNGEFSSPPLLPPAAAFQGDVVRVSVTFEGDSTLVFEADRANQDDVVTELLACRLRSRHERPRPRDYRILGQVSFASGSLTAPADVAPGMYSPAVRFASRETGQVSGLVVLGDRGL